MRKAALSARKLGGTIGIIAVIAVVFPISNRAAPDVTTLNFEDFSAPTIITSQYGGRGVLFPHGAYLDADPAARSGTRVLRADNPVKEFHSGPFVFSFTSGQARVRLFAGTTISTIPQNGVLRAFDAAGAFVAQDGPKQVAPRVLTTAFELKSSSPSISRVELEIGAAEFEAIDDLEFEGPPPPPPPDATPVVQISSPANDAQLDVTTLTVQGTVTGDGLFPTATLKVDYRQPPDSTAPPLVTAVILTGSGRTRNFAVTLGSPPMGPLVLTVVSENSGGLRGSAAVRVTNLPGLIQTEYASEGGAGMFGDFRWGGGEGDCKIAIYERGAISAEGGLAHVVRGEIFGKLLSLRDTGAFVPRLGCPTATERNALGGSTAQDFRRGRIYAGLPTGTHYVPSVFVLAIDQLGGEVATGLPNSDPTNSLPAETWLFQQFTRSGAPGLPSTLEISGSQPILWVERQGGDLSALSEASASLTANSPTIWQAFPCSGIGGPCDMSAPAPAGVFPPHQDGFGSYCSGDTYPDLVNGPPEWSAILGQYVLTPMNGIVKNSHFSDMDNPLTHENDTGPPLFPSDWNIDVRPLPSFRYLFADNSDVVEVELEYYFVQYFFVNTDFPNRGDLIFVSGRWIIDCGHQPYNSEIHPPSVMALMRTETTLGRPATRANIWVGGFYPGDPVEFDIFPPPRPSPDAQLVVTRPLDSAAAVDVNVELLPSTNHAHVRFTASRRTVPVTDAGEMKWQTGRGYGGSWYVRWDR